MSGAARRGALAQRHKGGRPAGRRLKIASIGTAAAGAAPVGCVLLYNRDSMSVKKDQLSALAFSRSV